MSTGICVLLCNANTEHVDSKVAHPALRSLIFWGADPGQQGYPKRVVDA